MNPDRELEEQYYTRRQAREVLKIEKDTFRRWITMGLIHRITLPGRRIGIYDKKEINNLAKEEREENNG